MTSKELRRRKRDWHESFEYLTAIFRQTKFIEDVLHKFDLENVPCRNEAHRHIFWSSKQHGQREHKLILHYRPVRLNTLLYRMQRANRSIFVDNLAAKAISEDPKHHSRTRHIRMRYHHTRHEVSVGNVKVCYMKTTELPADIMTKSLSTMQHNKLRLPICGE